MALRTITYDDAEWQVVPKKATLDMVIKLEKPDNGYTKWEVALSIAPEPPASMLTQRELTRAINALGIDSRAGVPDYVLSDAIWAHLHGMPAKRLPAQPRRPYGTATLSEYGVIPECDGAEPPAQEPMGAEQIASACYTYRHDFGLLPEAERHLLMAEARRWAAAFGIGKGENK